MSPKSKKQFEEIRHRSVAAIKEAALELFAQRGYHNTSISQISKAAGISKGLLYNYFASKEALLEAIIWEAVDLTEALMVKKLETTEDAFEQLRGITEASAQMVAANLHYWKLLTSLAFQTDILQSMQASLQQKQREAMTLFEDVFRRLGLAEPGKEAWLYSASLDGIMLHYMEMADLYGEPDAYPLDQMVSFLLDKYRPVND